MRKFKKYTLQMIAGANLASIIVMWLVGYSDRINPVEHARLSTLGLSFPIFLFINFVFLIFWILIKKRYVIIPFLGFILCYVPIRKYMPLNIQHEVPEGAIKVMSYNVWLFAGWDVKDGENSPILDYIKEQNADILCLQEAEIKEIGGQRLDSIMKPLYQYKDTCRIGDGGDCITLYSKFPILSRERIQYPSKGNLSAAYQLKIGEDTVIVINNHLETTGLSPEDRAGFKKMVDGEYKTDSTKYTSKLLINKLGESASKRAVQADAVNAYIEAHLDKPIILCGDFNDGPISYARRTIAQHLTDCYVSTGNGFGISYNRNFFYVRIDNIMCSADFQPYKCRVDNNINNSDHYPIYCWLKKRAKP